MKIDLNDQMIKPFVLKLTLVRGVIESLIVAFQYAFFLSICIGFIVYLVNMANLLNDFKIKIIQARKGIFNEICIEEVEISNANKFPGFLIATQIIGFLITIVGCTLIFTVLFWGIFWAWIWTKRIYLLIIILPTMLDLFLEGWINEKVYDNHQIKKRYLAGPLDIFYFYLTILEGFGEALKRFLLCFIAFLFSQMRINKPAAADWVLSIYRFD